MLKLSQAPSEIFVPDAFPVSQALERTTHLGIVAHPDDIEFMGWHPILECIENEKFWLTGVIVSDGRSSPRSGLYEHLGDQEMVALRLKEQHYASVVGRYAACVHLMHSEQGKLLAESDLHEFDTLVEDLKQCLEATRPSVVFTHNLADSHPHHTLVALAAIRALRQLGPDFHPLEFYGGEVWRSLDWMPLHDKLAFDVGQHQNLTASLMGVFDSQIGGGKRYDLATSGRKAANATYYDPLATDHALALEYAMDLMPLLKNPDLDPAEYSLELIHRFARNVERQLRQVWPKQI